MDGNHRVMDNVHTAKAIVNNYWEYSVFFVTPKVQKERGPVCDEPPLFLLI